MYNSSQLISYFRLKESTETYEDEIAVISPSVSGFTSPEATNVFRHDSNKSSRFHPSDYQQAGTSNYSSSYENMHQHQSSDDYPQPSPDDEMFHQSPSDYYQSSPNDYPRHRSQDYSNSHQIGRKYESSRSEERMGSNQPILPGVTIQSYSASPSKRGRPSHLRIQSR